MHLKGLNEPTCRKYLVQSWTHSEQLKYVVNSVFYSQELTCQPSFCIKVVLSKGLKNDWYSCGTPFFF